MAGLRTSKMLIHQRAPAKVRWNLMYQGKISFAPEVYPGNMKPI